MLTIVLHQHILQEQCVRNEDTVCGFESEKFTWQFGASFIMYLTWLHFQLFNVEYIEVLVCNIAKEESYQKKKEM